MDQRGQTAIEYLLLIVGVLAFLVIAYSLWYDRVYKPTNASIANKVTTYRNLTNVS